MRLYVGQRYFPRFDALLQVCYRVRRLKLAIVRDLDVVGNQRMRTWKFLPGSEQWPQTEAKAEQLCQRNQPALASDVHKLTLEPVPVPRVDGHFFSLCLS